MEKFDSKIIKTVAGVMAESFKEDPLNQSIFNGVEKKDELLKAHSLIHIKHAVKAGSLFLLDGNPKAFLVGMDSRDKKIFREMGLIFKVFVKTFQTLGLKDLKKIMSNNKKIQKVLNLSWQKEFIKGRYYHVKIIAIDKDMRGTGAFRRLITPVIEFCDAEKIPMALETHNVKNVDLYAHFGFELVKTITSGETDIKQYCMIRRRGQREKD